jgi:hypothetical protein
MKKIQVEFLQHAGNDLAGEIKAIDARRAQRLARTGYVRIVEAPEQATAKPAVETAARRAPEHRG